MQNQMQNNLELKWGLYPGFLVPEEIAKLDEVDIWIKINNLGNSIYWGYQDADKPWTKKSKNDLIEEQYALEYLVYYTRNFGVEFTKKPSATEYIERNASYNAWASFWYNHFNRMTEEKYNEFIDAKYSGKDISRYMPTGNWKTSYTKTKSKKI